MQGIIDSILNWTLAVDWVASVKDWAVIFKDLATGLAAIFAIIGFNSWKKETEFKQKNQIATKIMKLVYQIDEGFTSLLYPLATDPSIWFSIDKYHRLIPDIQETHRRLESLQKNMHDISKAWSEIKSISLDVFIIYGYRYKSLEARIERWVLAYERGLSSAITSTSDISKMDFDPTKMYSKDFSFDTEIFALKPEVAIEVFKEIKSIVSDFHSLLDDSLIIPKRKL